MYEDFYRLNTDPFRLTPDPAFCFHHHSYDLARAYLLYAFGQGEGFVMIAGQTGTGKTTLIEAFQKELKQSRVVSARLSSTSLKATELLRAVAYAFAIDVEGLDKATLLQRIEQFLLKQLNCGKRVLLIIDEAQGLNATALEELRLLADLHTEKRPLLQVFLVGQEKLRRMMSAPEMEQFQQRVIGACRLEPMDLAETRDYVAHRLQRAGWRGDPQLTGPAMLGIYRYSRGVPRHINKICSRLLSHGIVEQKHELDQDDVYAVAAELRDEQLAPLDHSRQTVATPVDGVDRVELDETPVDLEDLAIRPAGIPEYVADNPMNTPEPVEDETLRRTDDTVSVGSPGKSPGQQHTAATRRHRFAAVGAGTRHLRRQIHRWAAVIYLHATRVAASTLKQLKQWRLVIRKDIAAVHWPGWLDRHSQLVLPVIALTVISLSSTGLAIYLNEDTGDYNRVLFLTEPADTAAGEFFPLEPVAPDDRVTADSRILAGEPVPAPVMPVEPEPVRHAPAQEQATPTSIVPVEIADRDIPEPAQPATEQVTEDPGQAEMTATVAIAALEPVAVEITAPPEPTRESEQISIAELLARAQASLENDRLLFPEDNSAFRYYQQILALEPDNPEALQGMDRIIRRYIALADAAVARQDLDKARRYVSRGLRVQADDRRLAALKDSLDEPPVSADIDIEPPPLPVEVLPVTEPEPAQANFFSRIRTFFTDNQGAVLDNDGIWDEDSTGY